MGVYLRGRNLSNIPPFFKIGISGTGLTMAPIRLWVSSNAGSNQGKEQLNRQVRRPLVQMAAVKLGSQTLGEVLLLVKWLQGPNFVDYCIIR